MPNTATQTSIACSFQFGPLERKFSVTNALALAEAAELVYSSSDRIRKKVVDEWQLTGFEFIESRGVQVFVAQVGGASVIVFRGTDEPEDWGINFNAEMKAARKGHVHLGFLHALELVKDRILAACGKSRAWITGHSLGGALAMLMAVELLQTGGEVAGLYTFGQPKVGDATFVDEFNKVLKDRTFRFVNNNDGVPQMPPSRSGYRHGGTLMYFGVTGKLYQEPPGWLKLLHGIIGWLIVVADWIDQRTFKFAAFESFADHAMRWYLANLRNIK